MNVKRTFSIFNGFTVKWWCIFCASVFVLFYLGFVGFLRRLWEVDQTHIATFTLSFYIINSMFIGWITSKLTSLLPTTDQYKRLRTYLQPLWLSSEILMGLGMVGTLIGFILTLSSIGALNIGDMAQTKQAIIGAAGGMSTTVLCTLAGLSCSLLTKLQLSNLGVSLENDDETA
jgi:hypothetical protein